MNDLRTKLVLIDFELERALLKKKQLEYYIAELYEMREDTFVDYENSQKQVHNCCGGFLDD